MHTNGNGALRADLELRVSRSELAALLQSGNRDRLRNWLGQQRVEGDGVSMALREYVWREGHKTREAGHAPDREQSVRQMLNLETRILGLSLRDLDTPDSLGPAERLGDVVHTRDARGLLFGDQDWYRDLTVTLSGGGPGGGTTAPTYDLPLEHRRYKKPAENYVINPGRIGSNFVHTWALDLLNVTAFSISAKTPNDIGLYPTASGDDKVTVVDSCNRVLQTWAGYDFFYTSKIVDLQNKVRCPFDESNLPYTRIYIILETSRDTLPGADRSFRIEQLTLTTPATGDEHAYVVSDDINYDYFDTTILPPNNTDFTDAIDSQNKHVQLLPPWAGGEQGSNSKMVKEFRLKPSADDGWFLLGLNTTHDDAQFYSVVYYNEIVSRLRVYLYNLEEDVVFTGHRVTVYLEGCVAITQEPRTDPEKPPRFHVDYQPLKGAFFPLDPNPKNWDRAEVTITGWERHTWAAFEIDVLYPMGANLPAVGDPATGYYNVVSQPDVTVVGAPDLECKRGCRNVKLYRSLYEDEFALHQRNVRLAIAVQTIHTGTADFNLIAEAVGQAVQQLSPTGFTNLFDAIKTGKDWFGYGSALGNIVTDRIKDQTKTATGAAKASADALVEKISKGFTIVGAAAAAAGGILKLAGVLPNDVLKLHISLAIHGKVGGTLTFLDEPRVNRYYLPGRFSIIDAFAVDGIANDNIRRSIDSCLPRYDRTLGLFGYAYEPWAAEVNVNASFMRMLPSVPVPPNRPVWPGNTDAFFFPARHAIAVSPPVPWFAGPGPATYEERLIPDLLPVIMNPRAEIDVIPALQVDTYEYDVGTNRFLDGLPVHVKLTVPSSKLYLSAIDRADSKRYTTDLQWLGYGGPTHQGWSGAQERDPKNPSAYGALRVNVTAIPSLHTVQLDTAITPLKTREFVNRRAVHTDASYLVDYFRWSGELLDWQAEAPMFLTDVIYCWTMSYVYVGDTRHDPATLEPRPETVALSAPVTMRIAWPAPFEPGSENPWQDVDPLTLVLAVVNWSEWLTEHNMTALSPGAWDWWVQWMEDRHAGNSVESSLLRG